MTFFATPDPGLAVQPRLFLLIRTIAFSFIMFLCFLWSILLSITLYSQWDVMNSGERAIILTNMAVDFTTVVMLPVLLLWQFRPWLDAARFAFLIIIHTGVAGLFTYKSPPYRSQCSSAITIDKGALCNLIISYVIISSWIVAALIICYACGLGVLFRRLSRIPPTPVADTESLTKTYLTV